MGDLDPAVGVGGLGPGELWPLGDGGGPPWKDGDGGGGPPM